jgi:hypothetical protein
MFMPCKHIDNEYYEFATFIAVDQAWNPIARARPASSQPLAAAAAFVLDALVALRTHVPDQTPGMVR